MKLNMSFLNTLINGVSLGSMYALIALGYTMVYGIAKMLNFAHGDIIMIGGISTLTIMQALTENTGLSPMASSLIALAAAVVICTVLGVVIEKVAYKPLRQASSLAVLITAIGMSYFLQNVALLSFGSKKQMISFEFLDKLSLKISDDLVIHGSTVINVATMIVIMILLMLFIRFTKAGTAMRAVSEDNGAAQLMGINVNGTISLTFAIGSALAGIAGFMFLGSYGAIGAYSGTMPGIKAFTAAVFGGIGSIPGAMIGGVLLGIIENFARFYLSKMQLGSLVDPIVFLVLILVLLIKPTGLLGKQIKEKV